MPPEGSSLAPPAGLQTLPNGDAPQLPSAKDAGTATGGGPPTPAPTAASPTPVATSTGALSHAELKKQRKEEKAARRAQSKEGQGIPTAPSASKDLPAGPSRQQRNAPSSSGVPKAQVQRQRRASNPKQVPHRPKEAAEKPSAKPREDKKEVALFGHLYGQPRRTTSESASKDVHPAVLALGLKISSYAICGSTARCVAMLLAFKTVIESYTTPPKTSLPRHLTSHLNPQIDYLVSCRPLATSMGNAIRWLKLEINNVDPDTEEDKAKAELCEGIDIFIRDRVTAAGQVIATAAQEKIQDGDVILTFAKSKVVEQTLAQAFNNGRKFKVVVIDSRPLHEGKNIAESLSDIGLDITYSTTHSISHLVDRASKVFLGAHSMLGNGRLYSRAGSAVIAMMAKLADVPVIVCCESIKFTDRVALDSIVTNEVVPPDELLLQGQDATALSSWRETSNLQLLNLMYDVTPAEYISMVITEHGSLPPSSVPVVHRLSTNT